MPDHGYEIEAGLLGDLVDGFELGSGYQQDFHIRIEVEPGDLRAAADAVARASTRIMCVTGFGKEVPSVEDVDGEFLELAYTPNYASGPILSDGHLELYSDWKGEIGEEAANACLAVVVQELQGLGVERAKLGRGRVSDHPRPFRHSGSRRACVEPDRGRALGRAIAMPDHGYEIMPELRNLPLEQPNRGRSNVYYRIEVDDRHLQPAAEAMDRVLARIPWVTEFGRELAPDEVEEAEMIELCTPASCGSPSLVDGGIEYSGQGWSPPVVADACLAVVVQELLAAGVPLARLGLSPD